MHNINITKILICIDIPFLFLLYLLFQLEAVENILIPAIKGQLYTVNNIKIGLLVTVGNNNFSVTSGAPSRCPYHLSLPTLNKTSFLPLRKITFILHISS